MSRTELMNRALGLYELVHDQLAAGQVLQFRDPVSGVVERVHVS